MIFFLYLLTLGALAMVPAAHEAPASHEASAHTPMVLRHGTK